MAAYFPVIRQRTLATQGDLIIPRYCSLPFGRELEDDARQLGAQLINTFREHQYLASIPEWYPDLSDVTPRTWFRLEDLPEKGPFFLKGATNSKKEAWDTHCYAETRAEAVQVGLRIMDDGLLGQQQLCIREFVPLKPLGVGFHGLPISLEYRFFCYQGETLSYGFYWSSHLEDLRESGVDVPSNPFTIDTGSDLSRLLATVAVRLTGKAAFYVVDVGLTRDGRWIVIELNDACMSGLSENSSEALYRRLSEVLCQDGHESKDQIRRKLSTALGLPVYFSLEEASGRSPNCPGWVAHVFDVVSTSSWEVHDRSFDIRRELRTQGITLTIQTHTVEATTHRYPWVRKV